MLFQVVLSMCALGQKKVSGNWLDKKNFITYPPALLNLYHNIYFQFQKKKKKKAKIRR